jgi:squalene-hopene/tetraprenyl-beta-curcumene cyclase
MVRHFARFATFCSTLVACALISTASGAEPLAAWNAKAAGAYLNARAAWWLDWSSADRGRGTTCVSCHTTVPYVLALLALAKLSESSSDGATAERLLAGVRTRVDGWDELAKETESKDGLTPMFGGAKREASLDTEAVLNALTLLVGESRSTGALSRSANRALDILWSRQGANGAWRWLEFGLRPWENDGQYQGAALAALAAATAGDRYSSRNSPDVKRKFDSLCAFLKSRAAGKQVLHDTAMALWAGSKIRGLFSDADKKSMIADLLAVQQRDGGWSLRDIGKTGGQAAELGWNIVSAYPQGAVSDGYATGLVVLALRCAGVPARDERLQKGIGWLTSHQAADGTWPVVYVNKERNPTGNVGKFNRDAGAGFALLALMAND